MKPRRIISVIGSLNIDLVTTTPRIPAAGETLTGTSFSTGCGGKGANQAVACVRLSRPRLPMASSLSQQHVEASQQNVTIQMIGAVGTDEFGPRLISGLAEDGIDVSRIQELDSLATGVAVILVEEPTGENRILLNPGANQALSARFFTAESSLGAQRPDLVILQFEFPLTTVFAIIETARNAGIAVLLNPAPASKIPQELFGHIDHLIVNESEAAILSDQDLAQDEQGDVDWGKVADEFLKKGVRNVVITLGKEGAYASRKVGEGFIVEAVKVSKVVDTTAAGDTFVGAYALRVVADAEGEWDFAGAVTWACKAAGRTVEKKGAQAAIPWADEVEFAS